MYLIDFAPVLIALSLWFIPLLSDGPPAPSKRHRRRVPPRSTRVGCHLHGLPPLPNRHS
jgi:hypothetical protein